RSEGRDGTDSSSSPSPRRHAAARAPRPSRRRPPHAHRPAPTAAASAARQLTQPSPRSSSTPACPRTPPPAHATPRTTPPTLPPSRSGANRFSSPRCRTYARPLTNAPRPGAATRTASAVSRPCPPSGWPSGTPRSVQPSPNAPWRYHGGLPQQWPANHACSSPTPTPGAPGSDGASMPATMPGTFVQPKPMSSKARPAWSSSGTPAGVTRNTTSADATWFSKPLLFPSVSVRPIIIWRIRRAVTGSLPAPPNSAARLNPNENEDDGAKSSRMPVNHGRCTSPLRSMRASSSTGRAGHSTRKGPGNRTPSPLGAIAPPSNATASDNTAPPPSPGPSASARRPNHASAPPTLSATYAP